MADLSAQVNDDGTHGFLAGRVAAQGNALDRVFDAIPTAPAARAAPETAAVPAPPPQMPLGQRLINAPVTTIGQIAGSIGSDIGRGVVDLPRQVLGGSADLVNNLFDFADVAVKHAEQAGLPNVYFRLFDEGGHWAPGIESAETFRRAQAEGKEHIFQLPTTGEPDTVTGNLVRTAIPFILGRGTTSSAVGQLPNLARDFFSGTVATDPAAQRLSNLIQQVAPNFLTQFLQASPDDEQSLLGHLKSGLEYAGYGAIVQGTIATVRALKSLAGGAEPAAAPSAVAAEAPPSAPERIVSAAVKEGNKIYAAPTHIEALEQMSKETGEPIQSLFDRDFSKEGFLTSKGRYVERDEASNIAADQDQIAPIGARSRAESADLVRRTGELLGEQLDFNQPEAARPIEPAAAAPPTEAAVAPQRDFLRLGDPLAPAVEIRPTAREAAMAEVTAGRMAGEGQPVTMPGVEGGEPSIMSEQTIHDYLAGARVDNPVNLNLERIGSNEDIADALMQVSRTIPSQAVQSHEATIALSDALGLQPANFLAGYRGGGLNSVETTALRFMLDSSAAQMIKYAEAARDPLASPEEKALFLRAFTTHRALQAYGENARTEAGRTLDAWKIMSQQRNVYVQAIGDLVRQAEGPQGDLSGLAEKIAALNPLQAGRFVATSMAPRDRLLTAWYNALLSSPTTVVKKAISDIGMATWNVVTTGLAEKFGRNVPAGETASLVSGYVSSFKDAIRAGGKALLAGESQFYKDYASWEGTPFKAGSDDQLAAIAMQRFRLSAALNGAPDVLTDEQPTRAAYEFIRPFFPTSWIAGVDDFAKVWNYRAELARLSWRAADGDSESYARLMDNPNPQLNRQAIDAALKTTFQEPLTGRIGSGIKNVVEGLSVQIPHTNFELPIGRMLIPFTKVPLNIARTAAENSPLGLLMRPVQATLRQGGPNADIQLARIGLGTGVSLSLADLAFNNYITGRGPQNPTLRDAWLRAGNQPYSLQIPGLRPVSLLQLEPFGMQFGAIADTFNILKFSEDEKDFGTLIPSLVLGTGNAMLSKTYFEGMARFLGAINNPEKEGPRWMESFLTGFEPQLFARVGRATDEWERAHYDYLDSLEERLPFLRNKLPPQVTLWGDPVPVHEGFAPLLPKAVGQIFSPAALGPDPEKVQPIDKWIFNNRAAFPLGANGEPGIIAKPNRTQMFGGRNGGVTLSVQLNPTEYHDFAVLAGNGLKDPRTGLGAKDYLNALVQGNGPSAEQRAWNSATPEARAMEVRRVVDTYRAGARAEMLADPKNRDLLAAITAGLQARAAALSGRPPGALLQ